VCHLTTVVRVGISYKSLKLSVCLPCERVIHDHVNLLAAHRASSRSHVTDAKLNQELQYILDHPDQEAGAYSCLSHFA